MYAIVSHVVRPAISSMRTVEPRAVMWKKPSRPPPPGDSGT